MSDSIIGWNCPYTCENGLCCDQMKDFFLVSFVLLFFTQTKSENKKKVGRFLVWLEFKVNQGSEENRRSSSCKSVLCLIEVLSNWCVGKGRKKFYLRKTLLWSYSWLFKSIDHSLCVRGGEGVCDKMKEWLLSKQKSVQTQLR